MEGRDDQLLFQQLTEPDACQIRIAGDKEKVCEAISILDADGFAGVVGIVDADFDSIDGAASRDNIVRGDTHDIEMMLIASGALDRLLAEYASPAKLQHFEDTVEMSVRTALNKLSLPLGHLRLESRRKKIGLRFDGLDIPAFVDPDLLQVDYARMVREVKNHSQRPELDGPELERAVRRLEANGYDPFVVCNGHDVVAVLSFLLRRIIGSQPAVAITPTALERSLRLACDRHEFATTALHQELRDWEARNQGFKLLPY
ncbi:MAG: DUF4435 domain-containing protein [Deltaproteobacteria bacterium]|nr:DUF4435 domain-containing protein [Deltaproteobacteria bacterium]MBI3387598.1 DUF4435 domain-containing protein [Deltaproteobacteria bacterium]